LKKERRSKNFRFSIATRLSSEVRFSINRSTEPFDAPAVRPEQVEGYGWRAQDRLTTKSKIQNLKSKIENWEGN